MTAYEIIQGLMVSDDPNRYIEARAFARAYLAQPAAQPPPGPSVALREAVALLRTAKCCSPEYPLSDCKTLRRITRWLKSYDEAAAQVLAAPQLLPSAPQVRFCSVVMQEEGWPTTVCKRPLPCASHPAPQATPARTTADRVEAILDGFDEGDAQPAGHNPEGVEARELEAQMIANDGRQHAYQHVLTMVSNCLNAAVADRVHLAAKTAKP